MLILFGFFLRRPVTLRPLVSKPLVTLGLISYPLYLLHQNLGLVMILKISTWFVQPWLLFLVPIFVLGFFVIVCYWIYRYFEKPLVQFFRKP